MCGIIGYIGQRDSLPILTTGLKHLEYRGYDSSGVAVFDGSKIERERATGKIAQLEKKLLARKRPLQGKTGIAHTRWATHGKVTESNAHPHFVEKGRLAIVHNGIIENYREIREKLGDIKLQSETDSEILLNLIKNYYKSDLLTATKKALKEVRGTYGILVISRDNPHEIIAARMGSPLVIGIGRNENFIASDVTPLIPHTRKVIYLEDGEIALVNKDQFLISTLNGTARKKRAEKIYWDTNEAKKGDFSHFMLKEIFDEPNALEDAIRGRVNENEGTAQLGGLNMTQEEMSKIERIVIVGCGSAYYAGLGAKSAFERLSGIPTDVEIASEFRYKNPILNKRTLVFVLSQSGETIDTLMGLREAKRKGAIVRGVVNVIGSTIAREAKAGTYIHAGPELSVASTKAYTNTLAVMVLYALQFGRLNKTSQNEGEKLIKELRALPRKMRDVLQSSNNIDIIARKYSKYENFFFLGRGVNYSTALEGSLKLKEISYIHGEAYPGGEMKHGPMALLSSNFPTFAIMTKGSLYEKMKSNVEEIRTRGSKVIILATTGDTDVGELSSDVIFVPRTHELLEPILNALPLQLFAYYVALHLGRDIDRPRNLAKSVTVE